jgi:hypothetical protein
MQAKGKAPSSPGQVLFYKMRYAADGIQGPFSR